MSQDGERDARPAEPRRTQLYGSVDFPDQYPPTIDDTDAGASAPALVVGDTLDRYQVVDVLGRGGMGEVLSARDEQLGRWVAIKRLRLASPPPEVLARFLREVRIQGRLEHPAVVPVYELRAEGDQPFFVMKQLTGTTLADVIDRLAKGDTVAGEEFTRQRLLRAFVDVCLAIEFAHTRGVVHRDLKPANVVLGDFGEVYVLDWGIARVTDEEGEMRASFSDIETVADARTVVGAILGTPGYISPEQIASADDLDGRADVYSLGCILFEILALDALHPRGDGAIASALAGIDARPSGRAPDREIPPELDAICTKATSVFRDQRFATARQLGEAVQAFLDGHRDSTLREELARAELEAANAALESGKPTARRDAMRRAARALALDPHHRPAADLVGHLMLDPPTDMPPEVERELDQLDLKLIRTSARFGTFAALAYVAFFPMMYWAGFRLPWFYIAGGAICAVIIVATALLSRRYMFWPRYIAIVGNLAMFALFSIVVSPVVFGPGPPIIILMILASQRRLVPLWLIAALTSLATMTPWILELAGVFGPVVSVSGSDLVLHTMAGELDYKTALIGLVVYTIALAQLAALLGRLQENDRRNVRRTMQLQTWQLRQLVPRVTLSTKP